MNPTIFESPEALVHAVAQSLMDYSLRDDAAHIALSGGSTPKHLYRYIVEGDFAKNIRWENLHFWWGDERCVPADDRDSNFGEADRLLFRHIDIPVENLHPIRGGVDPDSERLRYRKEMKHFLPAKLGRPQFDWILLGVGEDGHTASLFPGKTVYVTDEGVVVAEQPETGQRRLSLAAPVIRVAKRVTYLALGESKANVTRDILQQEGAFKDYPAANIQSSEGLTEWYLDEAAAKQLDRQS